MTTKYHRDTETSEGIEARRTPWMRQGPPQRPLSRRQRIFIIFVAIAVCVLLGQIAYRLNRDALYPFEKPVRGVGTIVAREAGDRDGGTVTVEIDIKGKAMADVAEIPAPYWGSLTPGDRVAVIYRLNNARDAVQLVECGMVALPDGNR